MKIISFVNPNFRQGPRESNAYFLPYSTGILWSYVSQFKTITDNYSLGEMIWRRDDLLSLVDVLKNHDIVCFSTYVWNKNYNTTLARELKKLNPTIKIIFGGPELPILDKNFFAKFPYIDIHVKQEGEVTFKNILEQYITDGNLNNIPGIIYNKNYDTIDTGSAERINNLDILPSPYLDGVFDKLVKQNSDVNWNAIIETNRGCPYKCTFCDWGSLTYSKVKKINLERVFQEIEWIAKNRSEVINLADANFGIFIERDTQIIDKLVECTKKYGFPKYYQISWAKNQKKDVVKLVKKIIENCETNNGVNVSVQSLTESVLNNIKRTNLESKQISQMFNDCESLNIPLFTELILGLPGETLDSWKLNFWKLFDLGNHTGIAIYQAQLLENAEMNLVQKEIYGVRSQPVYDYLTMSDDIDYHPESVNIVAETKDIPYNKMLDAHVFNWFITTFHLNGLTSYISRFFKKYYNIQYSDFYERLFQFLKTKIWFYNQEKNIRNSFDEWMTIGNIKSLNIDNVITITGTNIHSYSTMHMHYYDTYKKIFDDIKEFVYTFNFDKKIIDNVLKFQKNYIINAHNLDVYPLYEEFDIDLLGYLQSSSELLQPAVVKFDFPLTENFSIERFVQNVYFGRRRNFGKAVVTKCLTNDLNIIS